MDKKVIGLVGDLGAGKDTFCGLVKENYKDVFFLRFSDALTEILKMFFDEIKRDDQAWLGASLKEKFGSDVLVHALIRKVNKLTTGIAILNGIRTQGEADAIRSAGGKIIYITADSKLRWERVRIRKEKADDDVPYEKFMEMHKSAADINIPVVGATADYKIINNGSKEEFYSEIKKVIDSL